MQTAPTASSHHCWVRQTIASAGDRGDAEEDEGRRQDGARACAARADQARRTDPVLVGAADAVGVVVRVVDADLQRERDRRGRAARAPSGPTSSSVTRDAAAVPSATGAIARASVGMRAAAIQSPNVAGCASTSGRPPGRPLLPRPLLGAAGALPLLGFLDAAP